MYLKRGITFNLSNIKIILFFEIIFNFTFHFSLLIKHRSLKLKCSCMIAKIHTLFTHRSLIPSYTSKTMASLYVAVTVFTIRWTNQGTFLSEVVRSRTTYVHSWCSAATLKCIYSIGKAICYTFTTKYNFACQKVMF